MKHSYYLLLVLLLASLSTHASNFCPLQPGVVHQFTKAPGDTTYGVLLQKPGYRDGSDSVYVFRHRIGRNTRTSGGSCSTFDLRLNETLFGTKLFVTNPGTFQAEYSFTDLHESRWFVLKPRAPLNQPWFVSDNLSARVTARGTALVLGQPDSVVTITLFDGRAIRLSKNYGFVDGPVPFNYMRWLPAGPSLVLTALPSRRLGAPVLGNQAMYDFQPGDVFCYEYSNWNIVPGAPNNIRYSYGDSVLSRITSRSGDTLTYRIWRYFPAGGGPSRVYSLVVHNTSDPLLAEPTSCFVPNPASSIGVRVRDVLNRANWPWPNSRALLRLDDRVRVCGGGTSLVDSLLASAPIDGERKSYYQPGLGMILSREENTSCCDISTTLLGYRKGSEQWGTMFRIGRILATVPTARAAVATAAPNPFRDELSVTLDLSRPQPVALRLLNSLGQVVLDAGAQPRPAGKQQLVVATATLPAGMYTVLIQPAQGRAEHLKVLKQ